MIDIEAPYCGHQEAYEEILSMHCKRSADIDQGEDPEVVRRKAFIEEVHIVREYGRRLFDSIDERVQADIAFIKDQVEGCYG